ncbi:MAG: L-aspartate oxidase [Acidobacteria bacterium]|nr:L-aspartate oxidase [Acidobacteriota bacterium]
MLVTTDFLIVGSGIAALSTAAQLTGAGEVLILTKAERSEGSTGYAQGGIAAAIGPGDSPALHAADTIRAGDGLCHEAAVTVLVTEGALLVGQLIDWGATFDRDATGAIALAREGAHSVRRVLHARDATGREIERAVWKHVSANLSPRVLTHASVTDLLVEDGECAGVRFFTNDGTAGAVRARATLLATGGAGQVFSDTTNPAVATGDGIAMAFRAGARIADMEFVQFHPTALSVPGGPRFLLSEALRGEGAQLVNADGDRFMARYHEAGELAPRDQVARAMVQEAQRTGRPVSLSLQHLDPDFVHARFPLVSTTCRRFGLDLARDRIPVGPAAHYLMGGIETDLDGRSSLPGLYAAGETACTGVHGANRLASNSLLEGLVFGARAGRAMRAERRDRRRAEPPSRYGSRIPDAFPDNTEAVLEEVRRMMWQSVGLFRDRPQLEQAVTALTDRWTDVARHVTALPIRAEAWKLVNVVLVSGLIASAALWREESRGAHFRSDFPARDDLHWRRHGCQQGALGRVSESGLNR